MDDPYDVLGVSPDADMDAIRSAYRALLKDHHPDLGGSRERFLDIKRSYERLLDEEIAADPKRLDGETADGRVADVGSSGGLRRALTVEGEYLTVTLASLVHDMDLAAVVADRRVNPDSKRTVAFFDVYNVRYEPVHWRGWQHTRFVGDDGYMYEGSSFFRPHADELPAGWQGSDVVIDPGEYVHCVVIAQELPPGVEVEQIVYTHSVYDDDDAGRVVDTERYLFTIPPGIRHRLDRPPFDASAVK